jgi:hypothetical protein
VRVCKREQKYQEAKVQSGEEDIFSKISEPEQWDGMGPLVHEDDMSSDPGPYEDPGPFLQGPF